MKTPGTRNLAIVCIVATLLAAAILFTVSRFSATNPETTEGRFDVRWATPAETKQAISSALAEHPIAIVSGEVFFPSASGGAAHFGIKDATIFQAPAGYSLPPNYYISMPINRFLHFPRGSQRMIFFLTAVPVPTESRFTPYFVDAVPLDCGAIAESPENLESLRNAIAAMR